jgi:hypothetical protein
MSPMDYEFPKGSVYFLILYSSRNMLVSNMKVGAGTKYITFPQVLYLHFDWGLPEVMP